ncbi:MAG: PKD domain-containing protein, partial [Flavobacteriales bacterium]
MSRFDEHIRLELNNYEAPYDESAWNDIEKELNKKGKGSGKKDRIFKYSAAAVIAGLLTVGYIMSSEESADSDLSKKPLEGNKEKIERKKKMAPERRKGGNKEEKEINKTVKVEEKDRRGNKKKIEERSVQQENISSKKNNVLKELKEDIAEDLTIKETPREDIEEKRFENKDEEGLNKEEERIKDSFKENLRDVIIDIKSEVCEGQKVQFTSKNLPENGKIIWDLGDGYTSEKREPKHIYENEGV